jgi:hypothetical protein
MRGGSGYEILPGILLIAHSQRREQWQEFRPAVNEADRKKRAAW